jgi:hypothetical protein
MTSPIGAESVAQAVCALRRIDRRAFLKGLAAAGGLAALGLGGPADAATHVGFKFMTAAEEAVFRRLTEVSLPVSGTALAPLTDVPVLATLDAALLGAMEPHVLEGLRGGIRMFEDGPREQYGKPFSQLGDKEAAAFCDAWGNSADMDRRGLVTGLKKLVALSYWANPPTWAALGYDGPVSAKWGLKSIGNAPMPAN